VCTPLLELAALHEGRLMPRVLVCAAAVWILLGTGSSPARATYPPEIDAGFRLLYDLRFEQARAQFSQARKAHPEEASSYAFEAASYLFEEFYHQGVLTSEFFLSDDRLLGGIQGRPDPTRRKAFLTANMHAQELAKRRLKADPVDAGALFVLTITSGMLADYSALIDKRHFESLKHIREAEAYAKRLLQVEPEAEDAYLALGAANYIIGSLPGYKRFFLWLGGIRGDKHRGMMQLQMAAMRGHYLRPFAKILLALVALREKRAGLARSLLSELVAEFPGNVLFGRELDKLAKSVRGTPASP
jgi:tetratricopeptide (TPR) repeat protein